jgi:hypothetical protein
MFSSSVFLPLQWSVLKSVSSLYTHTHTHTHTITTFPYCSPPENCFNFAIRKTTQTIKISLLSLQPHGRPLFPLSLWFCWNILCIIPSLLGNLCCSTHLVLINSIFSQILLKDPNLSNFKLMHNSCMNLIWLSQLV